MLKCLRLAVFLFLTCFMMVSWAGKTPTNSAPTVILTSPANGANFAPPASIVLNASASDTDGTVAKVEFYQGSTLLGTSTAVPYSFTWSNVSAGSYTLTAKATDNVGAATTSQTVSITVAPPRITIVAPSPGSIVGGNSVYVSGTYFGDSGTTVWVDNGNSTLQAAASGGYFNAWVPIYLGSNTLTATVARRDKTFDAASVTVTGVVAPQVTFTSPASSTATANTDVNFAVNASSINGNITQVNFYVSGTFVANVASPPYQYTLHNPVAGNYTVTAEATDSVGAIGKTNFLLTVTAANTPPTASLTAPANNSTYAAPASFTLKASANDADGSVAQVEFLENGALLSATNIAPYQFNRSNLTAGTYSYNVRATDNSGSKTTSSPISVNVINDPPPSVVVTSPANQASYKAPATIVLSATANGSAPGFGIASVDFYNGTVLLGRATSSPYALSWTNVPIGTYTVKALATDVLGISNWSSPVSVVVNPVTPPSISLTSPAANASVQAPATISLAAAVTVGDFPVAKVDFYQGSSLVGTATSAPYSATWTNVTAGTYSITAVATDTQGNKATSAAVAVTVTPPPPVSITTAADNTTAMVSDDVTVTVNARSANGTISKIQLFDGTTEVASYVPSAGQSSLTYWFFWTATTPGVHSLTAVVTDSLNNVATSSAMTVQVLQAPTVSMSALGSYFVAPAYIDLFANSTAATGTSIGKVEIYNGTQLIATLTKPPFNYTWGNVPVGAYTLTAKTTDIDGGTMTSTPINITVGPAPTISIGGGLDGSTVSESTVQLSGTVQTPPNSAVSVNGHTGVISSDGYFIVDAVPLQPGANSLPVTVTTVDGQTATQTITVNRSGTAPFSISVNSTKVMPSGPVSFSISNMAGASVGKVDVLCSDGEAVSMSFANIDTVSAGACIYDSPGIYTARLNIYDPAGSLLYTATKKIYVTTPQEVAGIARGVLTGLVARLKDNNVALAMNLFMTQSQSKYNDIFTNLGPDVATAVAQLGQISTLNLFGDTAEIVLLRTVDGNASAFFVYVVLGDDGIWRIESM